MKSKLSPPPHPGAVFRDRMLPEIGMTKSAVARRLEISRTLLYGLIGERYSVTPEMAVKLARLCRNRPEYWLNLQRDYDLWHVSQAQKVKRMAHGSMDVGAAV
jgi:addiction module HigA family antidote